MGGWFTFLGGVLFTVAVSIAANLLTPGVGRRLSQVWSDLGNALALRSRERTLKRLAKLEKRLADADKLAAGVPDFVQVALVRGMYILSAIAFCIWAEIQVAGVVATAYLKAIGHDVAKAVGSDVGLFYFTAYAVVLAAAFVALATAVKLQQATDQDRQSLRDDIQKLQAKIPPPSSNTAKPTRP